MEKSGKGKKIIAGLVVGVLATTAIVCVAVPQVRNKIGDLINEIKNKFKSEKEKNNDRKEKIHDDDRYKDLDDDEKKDFDDKFDQIVDSDEYKEKTDEEKDKIIDKLIESEKIQQEVEKEKAEHESRKEENKQQLENLASDKQELEQKVQDLKDSGASEEEIKAAEQEQQKIEEQIKAAEQEKIYFETIDTVKDVAADNEDFSDRNPGTSIRKLYGIYKFGGRVYINAEITQTETIAGVDIISAENAWCAVNTLIRGDETYDQILSNISGTDVVSLVKVCKNKNAESHKTYFEQNKYSMSRYFEKDEQLGYELAVSESWENNGDSNHPEYIINVTKGQESEFYIIQYNSDSGKYSRQQIEKICPEFWAQLEVEQNKQSEQAQAEASVEQYATRNEAGEMKSFDYTAFRKAAEETKAKQKTSVETKQSNVLYDDLDFSL